MSDGGLSVKPVGLCGRYHFPGREDVVQQLKSLCEKHPAFQLPSVDGLNLQLRSNADATVITHGKLHDIALESILSQKCEWFQTVQAAISIQGQDVEIVSVGGPGASPPSVMRKDLQDENPLLEAETTNGDTGSSSGLSSGLETPSDLRETLPNASGAIAVVGMACRYPQAESLEEFWNLITSGKNAVSPLSKSRFNVEELGRDPKGPFWGNFLRDPDAFDHRFFKISGREAASMDPQQRLLLQVAYEAMESSGYNSQTQRQDNNIGCYIGVGMVDYEANVASEHATAFSATGTLRAFISGKVSHYFGWTGPSVTFDTACSSSAVAIHHACKVSLSSMSISKTNQEC